MAGKPYFLGLGPEMSCGPRYFGSGRILAGISFVTQLAIFSLVPFKKKKVLSASGTFFLYKCHLN